MVQSPDNYVDVESRVTSIRDSESNGRSIVARAASKAKKVAVSPFSWLLNKAAYMASWLWMAVSGVCSKVMDMAEKLAHKHVLFRHLPESLKIWFAVSCGYGILISAALMVYNPLLAVVALLVFPFVMPLILLIADGPVAFLFWLALPFLTSAMLMFADKVIEALQEYRDKHNHESLDHLEGRMIPAEVANGQG